MRDHFRLRHLPGGKSLARLAERKFSSSQRLVGKHIELGGQI